MSRRCQGQERLGGTESARSSDRSLSAQLSRRGWRGVRYLIVEALCSGTGAFYAPHSRLGWRRTQTTPGCRPGLPWAAASQLSPNPQCCKGKRAFLLESFPGRQSGDSSQALGVSPWDNVPYSRPGIDQGGCCRPHRLLQGGVIAGFFEGCFAKSGGRRSKIIS